MRELTIMNICSVCNKIEAYITKTNNGHMKLLLTEEEYKQDLEKVYIRQLCSKCFDIKDTMENMVK